MLLRAGGFSLIELLIVLLIMGLALGLVSLTVDSDSQSRALVQSAEQLARESGLALQEAEADGRNRGLALVRATAGNWSWRWYREVQGQWLVTDPDPGAGTSSVLPGFPGGIDAELRVDGRMIALANRRIETSLETTIETTIETTVETTIDASNKTPRRIPDIVFYASGEMTPFSLLLGAAGDGNRGSIVLCGDALGRLSLVREPAPHCQVAGS